MPTMKWIIAALCVAFCVSGIVFFHSEKTDTKTTWQTWAKRIRAVGPQAAYEELAHELSHIDPSPQHDGAHAFGRALFVEKGIEGLSICDNRFSYGCFHEVVGQAVATQGLGIVPMLGSLCDSSTQTRGCQHGLGHGILSFLGYSDKDLLEALNVCSSLVRDVPLSGCDAGVFMEYNLRTMLGTSSPPRAMDANSLSPCDSLNSNACYLWQPQWWWVKLKHSSSTQQAFSSMSDFCGRVSDAEKRQYCMSGIGMMTGVASGYNSEIAVSLCGMLPKQSQVLCRAYGANVFLSATSSDVAKRMCDGLENSDAIFCENFASGSRGLSDPI